jgi:hypothetical protein
MAKAHPVNNNWQTLRNNLENYPIETIKDVYSHNYIILLISKCITLRKKYTCVSVHIL